MAKAPNKETDEVILATLLDTIAKNQKFILDTQKAIMSLVEKLDSNITVEGARINIPDINIPEIKMPDIKMPPQQSPTVNVIKQATAWDVEVTERDFAGRVKNMKIAPVKEVLN